MAFEGKLGHFYWITPGKQARAEREWGRKGERIKGRYNPNMDEMVWASFEERKRGLSSSHRSQKCAVLHCFVTSSRFIYNELN